MTEKEKLQQLFDAALKSPTEFSMGPPKRAFPTAMTGTTTGARAGSGHVQTLLSSPMQAGNCNPGTNAEAPFTCPVLDDVASTELPVLLDQQIQRKARRHRIEAMVTAIVFFGFCGGGFPWFVQSPSRFEAFTSSMREIRSVGDVKSIIARYQIALDGIAARGQLIDQASAEIGTLPSGENEKDPYFDAEMKDMMGGGGKTAGDRGNQLKDAFGNMRKQNEQVAKTAAPQASMHP